ncbi:hypothetical protein [Mycobacteroides abscessus]|uniref:hypothetical protein n=1 Tax=Mycobacteroides abscessus TaxID=36809 RepID=UPI000C260A24|nr:hypothetical protein [Mycobacteroides abscessus]
MAETPEITAPVTVGQVSATLSYGIPVIGISGSISHLSGRQLQEAIWKAVSEAGATIDLDL